MQTSLAYVGLSISMKRPIRPRVIKGISHFLSGMATLPTERRVVMMSVTPWFCMPLKTNFKYSSNKKYLTSQSMGSGPLLALRLMRDRPESLSSLAGLVIMNPMIIINLTSTNPIIN